MTAKQTICAKQNSIIKAFVVLVPNLLLPEGALMGREVVLESGQSALWAQWLLN